MIVFFIVYVYVFRVFACISKLVRVVGSQTERSQIEYEHMMVDLCLCAFGFHHSHEKIPVWYAVTLCLKIHVSSY